MLEHGGRLREAAEYWGIPLADWVDLSTGIAPWSYPVAIPAAAWQRLPEDGDGLEAAAAAYYGHPAPLPLPGTQAAIQWLPRLLPPCRVAVLTPGYGEYAPAWRTAGHEVRELAFDALAADDADVVMMGRPNNPDGATLPRAATLALARAMEARGGWLVVDEAFGDMAPAEALAPLAGTELPRLVVLRSLGKFFGLAGARVGFLCAAPDLCARLAAMLGPWAVAHPARAAAIQALGDRPWQTHQRERLMAATLRLRALLGRYGLPARAVAGLFCHVPMARAAGLHEHMARRGILLRHFDAPEALRFGLPGDGSQWRRLDAALETWKPT